MRVFVEAAARLHFGVLDLRGVRGRRFGGIGAAVSAPTLLLSAKPADTLHVEGADADRAATFARRFLAHAGIEEGVRLNVHRALPPHSGLGSGTQLALSVARAIAALYDLNTDVPTLAAATGRGRRSAVGTWLFERGGFVVEGGHDLSRGARAPGPAEPLVAPLVASVPFPASWRCVLAVPTSEPAVSGAAEDAAIASLPAPSEGDVERVAHLVRAGLLPAIKHGDLRTFGDALTEIQQINGRWFTPAQGGPFAPGASKHLVRRMADWGASGVGQSSWGPAVYGIVDGEDAGAGLASCVRAELGTGGSVYQGAFSSTGARVWYSSTDMPPGM